MRSKIPCGELDLYSATTFQDSKCGRVEQDVVVAESSL